MIAAKATKDAHYTDPEIRVNTPDPVFSFFLAIPTMFAASAKDIMDSGIKFNKVEWTGLGVGFIVSFFVALIVIKYFMKFVQNKSFIPFGYYRIVVGIIVVVLITTGFYS